MKPLYLSEFKNLSSVCKDLSLLAQEVKDGKYALVAVDTTQTPAVAFYVRHRRTMDQRTWRLDRLIGLLKGEGLFKVEVRSLCV